MLLQDSHPAVKLRNPEYVRVLKLSKRLAVTELQQKELPDTIILEVFGLTEIFGSRHLREEEFEPEELHGQHRGQHGSIPIDDWRCSECDSNEDWRCSECDSNEDDWSCSECDSNEDIGSQFFERFERVPCKVAGQPHEQPSTELGARRKPAAHAREDCDRAVGVSRGVEAPPEDHRSVQSPPQGGQGVKTHGGHPGQGASSAEGQGKAQGKERRTSGTEDAGPTCGLGRRDLIKMRIEAARCDQLLQLKTSCVTGI